MTRKEVQEVEILIQRMIRRDLSAVLQRLVGKVDIDKNKPFMEEVKQIAKDYDLPYLMEDRV